MANNIALFVTHSIFLTKEQIGLLDAGEVVEAGGHSVPVWVDAGTGRTTEPGEELFCLYRLNNSKNSDRDVIMIPRLGYEIFLPGKSGWALPKFDAEKIAEWPSERRMPFLREVENWWFLNPKPHDMESLKKGYMRFEVKKNSGKDSGSPPEHHVIEVADIDRLIRTMV